MKSNVTWYGAEALFFDCYIKDNVMWFVTSINNRVMSYDIGQGKLTYYTRIEDENCWRDYQFLKPIVDANKVFLIPADSDFLYIYDYCKNKITDKISLPGVNGRSYKFTISFIHKGYIYCFPKDYDKILKYDIANSRVEYIDECLEELKNIGCNSFFGSGGYYLKDDSAFLPCWDKNIIAEYNFNNDSIKLHMLDYDIGGIFGIRLINKTVWMISSKNGAVYYLENGGVDVIRKMPKRFSLNGETPFSKILKFGNDLVAVNYHANMPVLIDTKIKTAKSFIPLIILGNCEIENYFAAKELLDGRIIVQSRNNYKILCLNAENNSVEEWKINEFINIHREIWSNKKLFYEKHKDSLGMYIKTISESPREEIKITGGNIGFTINTKINSLL